MEYRQLPEFSKEFKKLRKKYRSLGDDLAKLEKVLAAFPYGNGSKHWNSLFRNDAVIICKVRLACAAMKGRTPFRVIYAYRKRSGDLVEFIEIYFKGNKEGEDRRRIDEYRKKISQKIRPIALKS